MPKNTSKITHRDKIVAWRAKYLDEIAVLAGALAALLAESKKLKSDGIRLVDQVFRSAEKMRHGLEQDAERRRDEIYAALVKKHGEPGAQNLMDRMDTSTEDERDEETCNLLDEIPSIDVDDAMSQAIDSLDILKDQTSELLTWIRGIK